MKINRNGISIAQEKELERLRAENEILRTALADVEDALCELDEETEDEVDG